MNEIIQLKITLEHTKPPIWRRLLVGRDTNFFELHHIIQIAMGWDNYHLYEFKFSDYYIGEPDEDDDFFGLRKKKILAAKDVSLTEVITDPKDIIIYEYDFGDGWKHKIKVEKFLPQDENISYPICIDGGLNCPPEDCGGIPGFYNLLGIMANKRHPERKEMLEWLGGEYDPEYFDIDQVNEALKDLDEYIEAWDDEG